MKHTTEYKRSGGLRYWIIFLILVGLMASCATTRKDGCGTENYKHKFNK